MSFRRTLLVAFAGAVCLGAPALAQTIDARQDFIMQRIEDGVRSGALTREEARRLREQFRNIADLERQYRRDGRLTDGERRDLNNRLNDLSGRIEKNKSDTEVRADNIYDRRQRQEQYIRDGINGGGLTRYEADQLYAELNAFDRQLDYDRRTGDGLDLRERNDLNRRLDVIANHIEQERKDGEKQGNYNSGYRR